MPNIPEVNVQCNNKLNDKLICENRFKVVQLYTSVNNFTLTNVY